MSYRRKDPNARNVIAFAKASGTAINEGELVKKNGTSNNVTAWATDGVVLGIALETLASASTGPIKVDVLTGPTWLVADSDSAPTAGLCRSIDGDVNSVDPTADTNHDFFAVYNGTTTTLDVLPKKYEATTDQ